MMKRRMAPLPASDEQAVRDAARELHSAIGAAHAAGYRVLWPTSHEGLTAISISETAAVKPPVPAVPTFANPNPAPIEE